MSDAINKNTQDIKTIDSKVDNLSDKVDMLEKALISKTVECNNLKALLKNNRKRLSIVEKENDILQEQQEQNE